MACTIQVHKHLKRTTLCALVFLHCAYVIGIHSENVHIKLVDSSRNYQPYQSLVKTLTLRTDPAPLSGPAHMQVLNGECFKGKEKGYDYTVCPFQNVTQKEESSSWNSFHGVLGVWKEWIVENSTLTGMYYTMGESCGVADREAKVMLNCSTRTRVHSMSEETKCCYTIWLDTPLACLKGAMQIYHLLSESQLTYWDQIEQEFLRDELTLQGLSKLRKKVLQEAGLLSSQKPTEKPSSQPEVSTEPTPSPCQQEKVLLETQLSELQQKVDELIKVYPAIAKQVGFALPTEYGVNSTVLNLPQENGTQNATTA